MGKSWADVGTLQNKAKAVRQRRTRTAGLQLRKQRLVKRKKFLVGQAFLIELQEFEKKYGFTTEEFPQWYENDQLKEALEFSEWAGECRLLEHLQEKQTTRCGRFALFLKNESAD